MSVYVTFYSTHDAIKSQRIGAKQGWTCELVPVPRDISANCGMALFVERGSPDGVRSTLEGGGVEPQGVVERDESH